MLTHAIFIPHSPLLVPTVHPEGLEKLSSIVSAIQEVRDHLYTLLPDTFVILSGHGSHYPNAFSAEMADAYADDLRAFGDLSPPSLYTGNPGLVDTIQRRMRKEGVPFTLHPFDGEDYGVAVTLRLFAKEMPHLNVVPLAISDLPRKNHFHFGQALRDVFEERSERIAVIAIGDLSHCLSSHGPVDVCKEGKVFDEAVISALSQGSSSALLSLSEERIAEAKESGYRPLLILMGALDHMRFRPEVMAYDAPYGVGYLVAQFHLR